MEFNFISFYNDHRNKFFLGFFGKMEGRLVSQPGKLSMAIADNKVKVPQRDKHSNRNTFQYSKDTNPLEKACYYFFCIHATVGHS